MDNRERTSGAHMCRDDHIQIWHNDGEHEQCPLCRANYEIDRLRDLVEQLKLQAQCHAQEARTANGTIAEAYQAVSGATGEPGNWNGAVPIRAAIERQREALTDARMALNLVLLANDLGGGIKDRLRTAWLKVGDALTLKHT